MIQGLVSVRRWGFKSPFGHQKTKTTLWVVLCFLRLPDGAEVKRSVLREAVSEVERSETESNGPPSGTPGSQCLRPFFNALTESKEEDQAG